MTSVSPTCSALRSWRRNSKLVCATSIRRRGAAPAAGTKVIEVLIRPARDQMSRARGFQGWSRSQLPSGDVEEHVLERAPLDSEILGENTLRGTPRGKGGEQLRGHVAGHEVLTGLGLVGRRAGRQHGDQ